MYPWGNKVSGVPVSLRTDIADPVERLYASREAVKLSMEHFERNRDLDISGIADLVPDFIGGALMPRMIRSKVKKGALPLACNLGISNVPGPPEFLYLKDARVDEMCPVSTLLAGSHLNITLFSYAGTLHFGLVASRELGDLERLADYIEKAFVDLEQAVFHPPERARKRGRKGTRKKAAKR